MILDRNRGFRRPSSPSPSPLKGGGEIKGTIPADSLSAPGGGEGRGEVGGVLDQQI